jgi:predicted transcriptional regulator
VADVPRSEPAAQIQPESTLRNAMELIMTSQTSVAVIDDGGRFGGMVTLNSIRESLGHAAGT